MNIADIAKAVVRIESADLAKINRVRAWARRNRATVVVSRYARDAYEGHVAIQSPWNESRDVAMAKAAELRALLSERRVATEGAGR